MDTVSSLAQALGDLDEATTLALAQERLSSGEAPLSFLGELQAGMNLVGERFEAGEYFLSELIHAFEDMKETIDTLQSAGLRDQVTILVGGGPVDEATRDYVGADICCKTAQDGVAAAKQVLGVR